MWRTGLVVLVLGACSEEPQLPTHEGNAKIVARDQDGPRAITASDEALYWLTGTEAVSLVDGVGQPVVLASGLSEPTAMCLTSSEHYVITFGEGAVLGGVRVPGGVFRVPLGGGLEDVFRPDTYGPSGLACDDAGVYWMQMWSSSTTPSGLMSLVGDSPTLLVTDVTRPRDVTLDADFVYWSDGVQLMRAPRALPLVGEVTTTSPRDPQQLTVDRGELFWIAPPTSSGELASVFAAPVTGGAPRLVAEILDQPTLHYSIAVDADFVYWTEFAPGRVMRVARGGGEPEVVADGQGGPTNIVLRHGAAYWTNFGSNNVVGL
ncbi:MAG TPA: hypothetical protein VL326_25775 [Kofleriaceae bacterium]|jgi:hypothetical protein|nr:hypothetical protein [Kofleriaceae bacterium]